ncbi:hypothetical protein C3B47_14020 [Flavobacterium columnare]|uniref:hypothetical protein n=1 Tax=Flavobacterium columnare TaxID=996 RepID=UPI0018966A9A|nr:hypothetical protein [Flavobacterium columnare]MBF6653971.1 hypothetical protein [Flavobacterium columnare]MBF6654153.1 hypothetical protein [Flavobacterium columnare]MBF6657452.1 hypothetical protein [Flavobacterium columnare]
MSWIGINNDIFKQTSHLIEVSEIKFEQFAKDNNIEQLTKLYFEVELHLVKILDFVKINQINESQFLKLEFNFKKLADYKIKYSNKINLGIYRDEQEVHFFYDDILSNKNEHKEINSENSNFKKLKSYLYPIKKRQSLDSERFNVDILFATGQAQFLYEKYKNKNNKLVAICLEAEIDLKLKPYFSFNFTDKKKCRRNIYNHFELMLLIEEHCLNNNIIICEEFKNELEAMKIKKSY